ncbi:hypothetical protein C1H57_22895 [Clostridium sp. 2-1]|uniref:hypothetical protein n=1 Tax=Clostridium beijerinckii TaxID=1520 RepID=UPI000CDB0896|nr:hypothetical protein [Clostridium beijerinckii]POO89005.1 hypothetical protein C1H57_22895 [Clostridium sp. 2-1]MBN7577102.1 hypothetical protein [Clostridium beijerinckii]MBN7580143.1 hypothetical protein [Clostridium beijerinckii]MBN7586868.1 hypothetical protein [Clostridium beijerinckii]MBO0523070.1 hypothetical protein [Clostridium beijerinckii]
MSIIGIIISIFLLTSTVLTLGFIKKKFSIKKIFKIIITILLLICCIIFGAYKYFQRSSSFMFTKTTTLGQENIDGIQMYESIDSKEFIQKYGTNLEKIDNALFNYYKLSDGLEIATNKQRQIIRVIINSETNSNMKTSKGIRLGSSVDDVINAYGTNYYKRTEEQMPSSPVIGYVDHEKKVTIEFWNAEDKVVEIRYDITSME